MNPVRLLYGFWELIIWRNHETTSAAVPEVCQEISHVFQQLANEIPNFTL